MMEFPETEAGELEASDLLLTLIKQVKALEEEIAGWGDPAPNSELRKDMQRAGSVATHLTARMGLQGAAGCLGAIEAWLGIDLNGGVVRPATRPYAGHAILRNAMEYAAAALWILNEDSPTGRIKRVLSHELEDARNRQKFAEESGLPMETFEKKLHRLRRHAEGARVNWNPSVKGLPPQGKRKKDRYPTQTDMLMELEAHSPNDGVEGLSWLAHWQVASGLAHGKQWAFVSVAETTPRIDLSGTHGHSYSVTMPFKAILTSFYGAQSLLTAGVERYRQLAGQ